MRTPGALDAALILCGDALLLALAFLAPQGGNGIEYAMTMLGSLAALSLALIGWFALRRRADPQYHGFLVLQAAFAYWYLLPMALTAWRGQVYVEPGYRDFSATQIRDGSIAVLLTKFVSTCVYHLIRLRPMVNMQWLAGLLNARHYRLPVFAVGGQLALGFIPFLLSGKPLAQAILGSRSGQGIFPKSVFGDASPAFGLTFLLSSASLLGFGWFLLDDRRRNRWVFLALGVAGCALAALAVGTRTTMLATVMPMVSLYALGSRDRWRIAKVVLCVAVLWLTADLMLTLRQTSTGFEETAAAETAFRSGNLVNNDFFGELLYTMEIVPAELPFTYESPMGLAAVGFIPRAIWPDKPYLKNAEKLLLIRLRNLSVEITGSTLPGITGEYWLVAGWLGVVVAGVWIGVGTALADHLMAACNRYFRYLALAFIWALFISFRMLALSLFLPTMVAGATVLLFSRGAAVREIQCV